nr:hypothetical protein Lopsy_47 [Mycobacterium phage Lopsy]
MARMPRYMPLRAGTYTLSSGFGPRWGSQHRGLDFAAKDGTPIYAAQGGTVAYIGRADGFGQWIVIDHPAADGSGTTVYGHMWDAFATGLRQGQRVEAGQLIAYVGSNGQSTGAHLHFEVHPTVWRQGSQIDPKPWLANALNPGDPAPAPEPAPAPPKGGTLPKLTDPFTGELWSPNRYHPRGLGDPRWIVVHTQEGGRTARDLAAYLAQKSSQVSYHVVVDDREVLKVVAEGDAPWAAAGANKYAFHICMAGSYASWSRNKWLDVDTSDGKNEDLQLTKTAHVIAWWCDKYGIPPVWIGGRNIPPWGLDGVCGHGDLGAWGGGHTDPGPRPQHPAVGPRRCVRTRRPRRVGRWPHRPRPQFPARRAHATREPIPRGHRAAAAADTAAGHRAGHQARSVRRLDALPRQPAQRCRPCPARAAAAQGGVSVLRGSPRNRWRFRPAHRACRA